MTRVAAGLAAVLLIAVLDSALAHRTILSTAVVFLLAGIILGLQTTIGIDLAGRAEDRRRRLNTLGVWAKSLYG